MTNVYQMRFLLSSRAIFLGAIFLSVSAIAATPYEVLDALPVPLNTQVQIVSAHSVSNGMPIAMATLETDNSADSVIRFYQRYWSSEEKEKQPAFALTTLPDWQLISKLHDGYNIVVQLDSRVNPGTVGLISVMAVDSSKVSENHGEFGDLKLLSSNRSVDGVDTSLMRVYASSTSVSHTHTLYRQRLKAKGWQLLTDSRQNEAHVMIFTRKQSRLELSIMASPDFGSVLVAHEVISQ